MLLTSAVNCVWFLYLRVNLVYQGLLFVMLSLFSCLALQQVEDRIVCLETYITVLHY